MSDSVAYQRNIWLMYPGRFYALMVPRLAQRGINVTYVCGRPELLQEFEGHGNPTLHSVWDALVGKGPQAEGDCVHESADPELLRQMRECELVTMYMLERLNYYGFRLRDLKWMYLRYVNYWLRALKEQRPDAVAFAGVPHMGYDYVLYGLCKQLGIRTLITERTSVPDRLILFEDIDQRPCPPAHLPTMVPSQAPGQQRLGVPDGTNYYSRRERTFRTPDPGPSFSAFVASMARQAGRFIRELIRHAPHLHDPHRESTYSLSFGRRGRWPRLVTHLWHRCRDGIVMHHARWCYQRLADTPDLSRDYVYFPLHLQPERSVLPMAAFFADQLSALRLVVDALPPGWVVYVKEHPRQFWDPVRFRLARGGAHFYRAFREFGDRVRLVSAGVDSEALVAGARCVATLAGTGGWEAVNKGVPALVFGTPWYVHSPGIRRVTSRRSCVEALDAVASGRLAVSSAELARYRQWLVEDGSFRGYFEDVFEHLSTISPAENAESHADVIAARLNARDAVSRSLAWQ